MGGTSGGCGAGGLAALGLSGSLGLGGAVLGEIASLRGRNYGVGALGGWGMGE
jgi:hypothetical protein